MARSPALWIDVAVKALLVGLLAFAVARPDLQQFAGKAMTGRAVAYPLTALIVPVLWFWIGRRRNWDYPFAVDILIVLPFLIDVAGNAADLYDTISWWDDANHFVNWAILVAGFGQVLVRTDLNRWLVASLAVGFGFVTAVLWEFIEYFTFIRGGAEEKTAYTDTLGDLALGGGGSVVAAVLTATVLFPKRERRARSE
jgi:uncharacterized membrane protein YjdF